MIGATKSMSTGPFEHGKSASFGFVPVHRYIALSAETCPDALAVRFGQDELTYQQLHTQVELMSARLANLGVTKGSRVAIWMPRSLEMIVSLLGILRAGGVYVPIDHNFPAARITTILDDCDPHCVLTLPGAREIGHRTPVECVSIRSLLNTQSADCFGPEVSIEPSDAMYIIYTSGTTGKPKGIVQNHGAISNLVAWQNECTNIGFSAVLQYSSISFDVHLQEMFSTWAKGGKLCLVDEESRLDTEALTSLIADEGIETLYLSVSALQNLVLKRRGLGALPKCVKHIVTAGEQLYVTEELSRNLRDRTDIFVHNHYGVSESHVVTSYTLNGRSAHLPQKVPVGKPIANVRIIILDEYRARVPIGIQGEIWIAGPCLSSGYWNRPDLDAAYYFELEGERFYKTRDIGAWLPSGDIEFYGRIDTQVKISGSLVEPGEVEARLLGNSDIGKCAVVAVPAAEGNYLVAYYSGARALDHVMLRAELRRYFPPFMIPAKFVFIEKFPTGETGKVDRKALVDLELKTSPSIAPVAARRRDRADVESLVASVFARVLHVPSDEVDTSANFFELGAGSLQVVEAARLLSVAMGREVSPVSFYRHPSIQDLASFFADDSGGGLLGTRGKASSNARQQSEPIAIVGMAGRFPGCQNIRQLWSALLDGRDCLVDLVDGEDGESWLIPPISIGGTKVERGGILEGAYEFDPAFFGISEKDALWMDPQHRVFLQSAYHALEDAFLIDKIAGVKIGVFAGCDVAAYLAHVQPHIDSMSAYLRALSLNDKDFVATRTSYALNLRGPSVAVQTACSTSLVAVHLAVQSLVSGDCDAALAGAVSIGVPQHSHYFYEAGCIYAKEGRMRPFDADAGGVVITNGVGVVCLKRLSRALEDGDRIYAVIHGSAVNNDGSRKAGYSAPSASGQSEVVEHALSRAGFNADSIDFIEAHGTGTVVGDPIEVEALSTVYGKTAREEQCLLGSVKGNIGHTNRAAGVIGLIKAALSIHHGVYPPTINGREVNPLLHLERGPFTLNYQPVKLEPQGARSIRGAVSSFGLGGTNAHVVLEAAPKSMDSGVPMPLPVFLMPLSAKSDQSLGAMASDLADFIESEGQAADLSNISYSLSVGRPNYEYRRVALGVDHASVVSALRGIASCRTRLASRPAAGKTAMLLPGGGAVDFEALHQAVTQVPMFAESLRRIIERVASETELDLSFMLEKPRDALVDVSSHRLEVTHSAIVAILLALADTWRHVGASPDILVGFSLGELAAYHLAGGMDLRTLFRIVVLRARFMAETTAGAMLSAFVGADEAREFEGDGCEIAILASRTTTIFSGDTAAIGRLKYRLDERSIGHKDVPVTRANHSLHMAVPASRLRVVLDNIEFAPTKVPMTSNLSGDLLPEGTVLGAEYWSRHIREAVRFADAVRKAAEWGARSWIELGLSPVLNRFVQQELGEVSAIALAPRPGAPADIRLCRAFADFWEQGGAIRLDSLFEGRNVRPVSLPPYPFEKRKFFLPLSRIERPGRRDSKPNGDSPQIYRRDLVRTDMPRGYLPGDIEKGCDIILVSGPGTAELAGRICSVLRDGEVRVSTVSSIDQVAGAVSNVSSPSEHIEIVLLESASAVAPWSESALARLMSDLGQYGSTVTVRIFLLGHQHEVNVARRAAIKALTLTVPQEFTVRTCSFVEIREDAQLPDRVILAELGKPKPDTYCLYERGCRWVEQYSIVPLTTRTESEPANPCFVLVGGAGRVGLDLTKLLAGTHGWSLALVGRGDRDAVLEDLIGECPSLRGRVRYYRADATSYEQLSSAFTQIMSDYGYVDGVMHLAAAIEDRTFLKSLRDVTENDIARAWSAKVAVFDNIEQVCQDHRIDSKIAFSSIATILGGVGYYAYTFSNLALEERGRLTSGWKILSWDVIATSSTHESELEIGLGTSAAPVSLSLDFAVEALRVLSTSHLGEFVLTRRSLGDAEALRQSIRENLWQEDALSISSPQGTGGRRSQLRAIWKQVLGVRDVADHDSFSSLGGDSLMAVQTVLSIGKKLGITVPIVTMMRAKSFDEFAQAIESELDAPKLDVKVRISSKATPWEERWFEMAPRGFGNLQMPIIAAKDLDPETTERALNSLIDAHESLRTVFDLTSDGLMRRVLDEARIPFVHKAVLALSPNERRDAVEALWEELTRMPFDLTSSPPIRAGLLTFGGGLSVLLFMTHHIAFDGWSSSVFIEDFSRAYDMLESGGPVELDNSSYARFAGWYEDYTKTPAYSASKRYWHELFGDDRIGMLIESPLKDVRDEAVCASREHFRIDGHLYDRILEKARRADATPFHVCFAAYLSALQTVLGIRSGVVGTTSGGRPSQEVARTIGVFVNPMPIPFALSQRRSPDELLSIVRQRVIEFQNNQLYPIRSLKEDRPELERVDLNALFDCYILYQNYYRPADGVTDEYTVLEADDYQTHPLFSFLNEGDHRLMRPLELIIFERHDGLSFNVWYRRNVMTDEQAVQFREALIGALRSLVEIDANVQRREGAAEQESGVGENEEGIAA